jgi:hypothetical protein
MNNVSGVSPGSVQAREPATDGSADELQDTLVPVQEDELPQGVLDLLASLILRQRPAMTAAQGSAHVERDAARPTAPVTLTYPQAGQLFGKPLRLSLPQTIAPLIDGAPAKTQAMPVSIDLNPRPSNKAVAVSIEPSSVTVEAVAIERPSSTTESLPVDRTVSVLAPSAPTVEVQLPEALSGFQAARHAPSVAPPAIPSPTTQPPLPPLDVMLETLPGPDRGLLQVPFNRGAVSGQVMISRVPDEPARSLQLSPSNAQVFEHLKMSFEQVREPAWRLTDSGGEQQHQGSHQSPDDEQCEHPELPA